MEITKVEVVNLERAVSEAVEHDLRELNDLQLSLIGGGIGEVIVG
jgi:hypothetical protein